MTSVENSAVSTELLTASQQDRRRRILEAARLLAAKGGYDGVQMREVSERAEVALGTLYRYFPSKVHLLVSVMEDQTRQLMNRVETRPPTGEFAADRVLEVLRRGTKALQRDPGLTEAMTRALMFADNSAANDVDSVSHMTTETITHVMVGPDREATEDDPAIARVIEQVWMSSIVAWLSGRSSASQMNDDVEIATRLLVR